VPTTIGISKPYNLVLLYTYKCDIIHKSNPHSYYGKPIQNPDSIILNVGTLEF